MCVSGFLLSSTCDLTVCPASEHCKIQGIRQDTRIFVYNIGVRAVVKLYGYVISYSVQVLRERITPNHLQEIRQISRKSCSCIYIAGVRRTRISSRAGCHTSRHQGCKYPHQQRWVCQARGLRCCEQDNSRNEQRCCGWKSLLE